MRAIFAFGLTLLVAPAIAAPPSSPFFAANPRGFIDIAGEPPSPGLPITAIGGAFEMTAPLVGKDRVLCATLRIEVPAGRGAEAGIRSAARDTFKEFMDYVKTCTPAHGLGVPTPGFTFTPPPVPKPRRHP